MIDFLKLSIPFKLKYMHENPCSPDVLYIDLEQIAKLSGIRMAAYNVEFEIADANDPSGLHEGQRKVSVTGLKHPWDSVPSSFTGIAMKIYAGGKLRCPCVEIKASPAKILQGHNVYGSDDLELCGFEMLCALWDSLPELADLLDLHGTELDWIDATFAATTPNQNTALQVITALKNIRSGQIRPTRKSGDYETSVYWNEESRHCERKAYLKLTELEDDLADLQRRVERFKNAKVINANSPSIQSLKRWNELNPIVDKLKEFAAGMVRFEARAKQRYLKEFGIPRNLFDAMNFQKNYELDGKNLIADLWQKAFKDLFAAFEGSEMNVYDDLTIHEQLRLKFYSITKSGKTSYAKADRIFQFFRNVSAHGYEVVRDSYSSRMSFWRMEQDLMAIGLGRSQLQQLTGQKATSIVPLIKMINVDFSTQRPAWAPEIVTRYEHMAAW